MSSDEAIKAASRANKKRRLARSAKPKTPQPDPFVAWALGEYRKNQKKLKNAKRGSRKR